MHTLICFLDEYLTNKFDWAPEDFGRKNYPDCDDFYDTLVMSCVEDAPTKITATYTSSDVRQNYGQAKLVRISAALTKDGVLVRAELTEKAPTLFAEAGHLVFDLEKVPTSIAVNKSSVLINPETDVVRGALTNLFAAEHIYFDDTQITPYHSPIVSFGKSEFYRFCCKDYEKPHNGKVYFLLFGNQLGTGSPQWLDGNITSEFLFK